MLGLALFAVLFVFLLRHDSKFFVFVIVFIILMIALYTVHV
jgi:hypothetical protein